MMSIYNNEIFDENKISIHTCFDLRLTNRFFRGFFCVTCSILLPFSSSDDSSDGE